MVKTAFVFPGQGSQSIGMLSDLISQYSLIAEYFKQASEVVGYDVLHLITNGPIERLNQTEHTQVAMLTADVAVWNLLKQKGFPTPLIMAGHSLGEYPALVAAEALTFSDAVKLVSNRAKVMQKAVPLGQGAMAAIVGLTDEEVIHLCEKASQENDTVSPANFNAIGQVVVAGHTKAVDRLIELALESSAKLAKVIPVSVPCHCQLLTEAAELFEDHLKNTTFNKPSIDVVSNVDLSIYRSPEDIRKKLKEQLYSPVRWVETINSFKNKNIELIIECGPGKVLSGLIKRIERSLNTISICDTISLNQALEST